MKKIIMFMLIATLMLAVPIAADVNMTINADSEGGEINLWANPNSGIGSTTYYIDGLNYHQTIRDAARSRGSIVSKVYNTFMRWRLQSHGQFGWEEVEFESLEPDYQRLRYVLENWFVPHREMVQIINQQQAQITQLNLEIEAIGKVLGEDKICEARKLVMSERNLPFITCGNQTWYQGGIGLQKVN